MRNRDKVFAPTDRPHTDLLNAAIAGLRFTRKHVSESLSSGSGLKHPKYSAPDGTSKGMLTVDQEAEDQCTNYLLKLLGSENIRVLGEETLWKYEQLDLSTHHIEGYSENSVEVPGPERKLVAIIDMIDGSDLVERNFGNWCSAVVFFKPRPKPEILFSLIHQADGAIYGADQKGTFLIRASNARPIQGVVPFKKPEARRLRREDKDKDYPEETRQISICFIGQKVKHFTSIPNGLMQWAKKSEAAERLRFYNLAGNPMMARLANGENVHVVFEHRGQHAHDAIPGLFIALQAGAFMLDLNKTSSSEESVTIEELASFLMKPSATSVKYVIASTKELALEFARVLKSDDGVERS